MAQPPASSPVALSYGHVGNAGTTILKSGGGLLQSLFINSASSGATVAIHDATTGSGAAIASISLTSSVTLQPPITYSAQFKNGLTIVTTGTVDATVIYR